MLKRFIRCALAGFALLNAGGVFATAEAECVIQPDGSCLKMDISGDKEPGGGLSGGGIGTGGGSGGEMGGGGGGSGGGVDTASESAANRVRNSKELCKSTNPEHSRYATVTSRSDSTDRTAAATAIYREDPVLQRAAVSSARRGIQLEFSVTFSDGGRQDFTVVAGSSLPVQESSRGNLTLGDGVASGCSA